MDPSLAVSHSIILMSSVDMALRDQRGQIRHSREAAKRCACEGEFGLNLFLLADACMLSRLTPSDVQSSHGCE